MSSPTHLAILRLVNEVLATQIKKAVGRYGAREVTFVGDRGMIKSVQIERRRLSLHNSDNEVTCTKYKQIPW